MNRTRSLAPLPAAVVLFLLVLAPGGPAWAANRCAGGGAARPDDSGIGGTGARPAAPLHDDSGVGGTGVRPESPEDDDSGVGGTGISAQTDTGVIGTITGFASICVGDVEIAYDDASVVKIDGQRGVAADLAVGQVVEILASGSGDDLGAREISVRHVVSGPVTRAAGEGGVLEVIGQKVRLTSATRGDVGDDQASAIGELAPGTFLRVSGLRQADGTIVASRVVRGGNTVQLSGPLESIGPDHVTIAGTTVRTVPSPEWVAGDEVRVSGSWSEDHVSATSAERVPRVPFDGRAGRVDVEGYPLVTAGGELRVGPYRFEVPRDSVAALPDVASRAPIRIEAAVREGRAFVERIVAAPELPPRPDGAQARPPGYDRVGDPGGRDAPRADRPDAMAPRPDAHIDPPNRPDRPDPVRPPDRPPQLDRPPPPARPELPSRPDRPPRPGRP